MRGVSWIALALLAAAPASATTYTVTSTVDSGPGSLRECIQVANANPPGPHRIVFNIPGTGVLTIHLLSQLDGLANPTAIDATSQPGYNGVPLIELDGTASVVAIDLSAPHSSFKGFVVNRFQSEGLTVSADACTVSACYFGTNAAGTAALGNAFFGLMVTGDHAMIGGHIPAYRNIISGNGFMGLALNSAVGDTVMNNYIGTDVSGTIAIPNAQYGLETGGAKQAVIDNNLVSGNGGFGIYVDSSSQPAPADAVRVTRNYVGTDASGMHALPNASVGVDMLSAYTILGDVGRGNVISGNGDYGVESDGAFHPSHNQILGNMIGVSADGTRPVGNALGGIHLYKSSNNIIGVSRGDGSGNIIGSNGGPGIQIDDTTSVSNTIQGNAIGTTMNGALTLGNTGTGITTEGNLATIGGSGLAGNVIAHNDGGVYVRGVRDKIEGNLIFQNGPGLGIDLMQPALGVTPNDAPPDPDDGGNHLQNYPVLTNASVVGSFVQLVGTLASDFSHQYTIDFYSNRACSGSGYGEGESWAGQLVATTDGSGNIGFVTMIPLSSVVGYVFTATATDSTGNTSEFSLCKSMTPPTTAADPAPSVSYALQASQPSPARGLTFLPFTLAHPSHVRLSAYDVSGRFVARLVDRDLPAGPGRAEWSLAGLAAGTYFCRLEAQANDGSGQHFRASTTVIVLP